MGSMLRKLHTGNWICNLPGSALKVPVGGGWCVGGWWWFENEFSDRLWLSFSLALAKPNKTNCCGKLSMNFCESQVSKVASWDLPSGWLHIWQRENMSK